MTKAFTKQLSAGIGTLLGWAVARSTSAKETAPYTVVGGLLGFAVGETLADEDGALIKKKRKPALSGSPRKRTKRPK